ncbi:MAG: type II toxin-antitoxin system HicB family antitoxin [Actinomycetota bacterium]|nr:type II toxin-antitoxin system HicB family antitoxin [Actinomycetota bacterium]
MTEKDMWADLIRRVDVVPAILEATAAGRALYRFEDGSVLTVAIEGPYELAGPDGEALARGDGTGLVSLKEGYARLVGILARGLLEGRPRGASWLSEGARAWGESHATELRFLVDHGGKGVVASAAGRAWLAGYRAGAEAAGTSATEALGLTAAYTPIGDGRWMARVLELPGAISQGETLEEVRENIADAVGLLLKARREEADRELEDREGAIREPLLPRPATEPEAPRIHELPHDVAMEILARRGHSAASAEEYLAISRGEDMDDVIYETEEQTRAAAAAPTEDED